jgi:hypothetical protein
MPTVHRIEAHKIQVFPGDHAPPHFHVWAGGCCDYQVGLETLDVMRGTPCARHEDMIAWAKAHLETLWRVWREQNEPG